MNPIALLSFLKQPFNLVLSISILVAIATPFLVSHCKDVKGAKEKAEKETEIKREEEKQTKKKVEVYNENQKEKNKIVEKVIEKWKKGEYKPEEPPPADEELKGVRGRVLDNYKEGLPK